MVRKFGAEKVPSKVLHPATSHQSLKALHPQAPRALKAGNMGCSLPVLMQQCFNSGKALQQIPKLHEEPTCAVWFVLQLL